MLVMSLLPGMPMLPFLVLGGGASALAWHLGKHHKATGRRRDRTGRRQAARQPPRQPPAEEPISTALQLDELKIELGYALLPLVNRRMAATA